MCKTKELLTLDVLDDGTLEGVTILNKTLLPESLKNENSIMLCDWLKGRQIDTTRSNARLLLKLLNLSSTGIYSTIYNRGLNLTDTYWLRKDGNEKYSDFCLYRGQHNKDILETVLNGKMHSLDRCINTELTNIGSFNKAWVKDERGWVLYKKGDFKSLYAELFTYKLGKSLGMNMAKYSYNRELGVIESLNFTNENKMLEHYATLKYMFTNISDTDERVIAENMTKVSKECFIGYTNMVLLDGIVSNIDRHEYNFGMLKSTTTGEIIGLAPNFDNNLALGSGGHPTTTYLLKEYLSNFGVLEHQKQIIGKLNYSLICKIDKEVKKELGNLGASTDYVAKHMQEVVKLLNRGV